MRYILNIGNTHSVVGDADGRALRRCETARIPEQDPLPEIGWDDTVFAGCVVPRVRLALTQKFGERIRFIDYRDIRTPDLSGVTAATMGADRLANAVALSQGPLPGLCVDFGTAIHSVAIDRDGRVVGGFILPGRQLMRNALQSGTAQLPALEDSEGNSDVLGTTTKAAMAAGIDHGARGAVVSLVKQACERLGPGTRVVLAGGDAPWFAEVLPGAELIGAAFTLAGLAAIARQ